MANEMVVTQVERGNPMARKTIHLRAYATIGGKKYEFTKYLPSSNFEAYDFPKSWNGIPRFIGYLTEEQGSKLMTVIGRAAVAS